MAMKLEHLRSFEAVARIGSFTRAADELFVAQPSLSRQIGALESDLGTELLRRAPSGVTLTAAGEVLLPIARRMLGDARTAREQLDELAGLRRGSVRLGAPPTLCVSLVADAVAAYRAAHPGVELHITEGGSRFLVDALNEGALDLALVVTRSAQPAAPATELIPLLSEELVVVSAASAGERSGAGRRELTLAQLASVPQVAFSRSYDLRVATDAAFAAAGLTPTIAVEGAEMDAVLRFVERGIGVAVVPAMVVIDRPGLHSRRLVRPQLTRTVNLARRTDVGASAAASEMQRIIFEAVDRLATPGTELAQRVAVASRA
ncbi:DNA-binding transcriptional regulator, LysR family [Agrococcus baldri]|uniref:DNA-binding transcriptional regulator, LysR family n=1 Tax=Agrococcus baldri TaxID=153730 RepID=A0AA94L0J5_9MICO|nr:LysR substrate-binding domain-containing protein [Agrococcus baldri]SFS18156.1 DNA-binding transcriptional regulator, LysR family [Agrococcus baldri]